MSVIIPRSSENAIADEMSRLASQRTAVRNGRRNFLGALAATGAVARAAALTGEFMNQAIRRTLPSLMAAATFAVAAVSAHAQIFTLKGASISVGGTGQFTTPLTTNPSNTTLPVDRTGGGVLTQTISNNQQFTTTSAGFLTSLQVYPRPWTGIEFNYGYTHYSEIYRFNESSVTGAQQIRVPVDQHEATAAYVFHPRHIKFQPYMNIGGGAIDFAPRSTTNQWRAAGLVETGFDIPTGNKHLAFRVGGRALIYRAPNFNTPSISTRSWRSLEEPSISAVYRF